MQYDVVIFHFIFFFHLASSCQNTAKHSLMPFKSSDTALSRFSLRKQKGHRGIFFFSQQKQNMIWNNNFLFRVEVKTILGGHKIRYCLRSWLTCFAQFGRLVMMESEMWLTIVKIAYQVCLCSPANRTKFNNFFFLHQVAYFFTAEFLAFFSSPKELFFASLSSIFEASIFN